LKCVTTSTSCHLYSRHIFQHHHQSAAPNRHMYVVISPVHMSEEHFDCFENYIAANSVGKRVSLHSSACIARHTKFTQADISLCDVTCRHAWLWLPLSLQFRPRYTVWTFNSLHAFGLRALNGRECC
jgi:hypothetical protein